MAACLVYVIGGPVFGRISDAFSLSRAFLVLGVAVLSVCGPLAFRILRTRDDSGLAAE